MGDDRMVNAQDRPERADLDARAVIEKIVFGTIQDLIIDSGDYDARGLLAESKHIAANILTALHSLGYRIPEPQLVQKMHKLPPDETREAAQGLPRLRQAIIDNTRGEELFWIGEILLAELEKETFFKG